MEGQSVTLRCKARGDPDPIIHWIAPDGRLMSNSSRAAVHTDGTLDILISTVKDSGLLTLLFAWLRRMNCWFAAQMCGLLGKTIRIDEGITTRVML